MVKTRALPRVSIAMATATGGTAPSAATAMTVTRRSPTSAASVRAQSAAVRVTRQSPHNRASNCRNRARAAHSFVAKARATAGTASTAVARMSSPIERMMVRWKRPQSTTRRRPRPAIPVGSTASSSRTRSPVSTAAWRWRTVVASPCPPAMPASAVRVATRAPRLSWAACRAGAPLAARRTPTVTGSTTTSTPFRRAPTCRATTTRRSSSSSARATLVLLSCGLAIRFATRMCTSCST